MTTNYDIKKERRDLYAPRSGEFSLVVVPALPFLMIDGAGDPNSSSAYRDALEALFALSYGVRAIAKKELGRTHTVGPLEGLWSAPDLHAYQTRDKSAWTWTMMIVQPEWATAQMVEAARTTVASKGAVTAEIARFEQYDEGLSVQIMHLGSYDAESPTIARMHEEFMPANGLAPTLRHHEIYLSDARKVEPAKLRTILRQPVRRT